jgi:hypothetical protein
MSALAKAKQILSTINATPTSHILNETACPIEEGSLSTLCSASPPDAETIALSYPPAQRAQLAYFCYNRQHMKALSHTLILSCERSELMREFAGITDVVIEQAKAELKAKQNSGRSLSLSQKTGLSLIG